MKNIDFHTLLTVTLQPWSLLKETVIFEFLGTDPSDTLSKVPLKKSSTKSSKIRSVGAVPLTLTRVCHRDLIRFVLYVPFRSPLIVYV